ncbi:symmetrical bis(5'-nucleosyl)-tetraphosphatase [Thorsellia kenyensis]|uniref:Bis(5'-nucleosyl)-tetraphosphatase, symmetrical n=1 Tax=Thorsellia kenyensis TaxID=1549888 RepID=A0ABV6CBF4_9GAMM
MATLIIGDIHGSYDEFMRLLDKASFNEKEDTIWLTGDIVARGKDSLSVLREVYQLKNSVKMVLGNHDLHLLAIDAGLVRDKAKDKLDKVLKAKDKEELLFWLRKQPLVQYCHKLKLIMTHAGVSPQWDLSTLLTAAEEVKMVLQSDKYKDLLAQMYGDTPNSWNDKLKGIPRLRFILNVLTRMRYCSKEGALDFLCKDAPNEAPSGLYPWFTLPRKIPAEYTLAFGHWAALNGKVDEPNILALDTGCVWGGELTLFNFELKTKMSVLAKIK